jgi:2-phosphosulfolactate phosphatase
MNDKKKPKVIVIVDAFRAFATASYVLERKPQQYIYVTKSSVLTKLASNFSNPLFIGKNEIGENINYNIPNSPTRVTEVEVTGRVVMHRTEAGAKGILEATDADVVLAAAFVNASATARYIRRLSEPKVTIIPMGHEAIKPSIEDDICAQYIQFLINGKPFDLKPFIPELKKGPGKYFFAKDQWQYPREDFKRCLETNRFNFAIRAELCEDYALLMVCE